MWVLPSVDCSFASYSTPEDLGFSTMEDPSTTEDQGFSSFLGLRLESAPTVIQESGLITKLFAI